MKAGSRGPGLYFVKSGGGSTRLELPKDPDCGWVCSVGFASTQVLGCGSVKGCVVWAGLFFIPVGKGAQLMRSMPWLRRSLMLAKQTKVVKALVKVGKYGKKGVSLLKKAKRAEQGAKAAEEGVDLLSYTSRNFRENLARLTGKMPEDSQAHHVFPQKFRNLFDRSGINVDDPHYGAWWKQGTHGHASYQYNLDWEDLFARNPSREQILQFGRDQAQKYGFKAGF